MFVRINTRFMRISVFSALLASAVTGMALISCDLLDNEVLIDDGTKITVTDSTTIRVMSSLTDSTLLVISTEGMPMSLPGPIGARCPSMTVTRAGTLSTFVLRRTAEQQPGRHRSWWSPEI